MTQSLRFLAIGYLCLSCLGACTDSSSETIRTFVSTTQQQPVRTPPPLPSLEPITPIAYRAQGRRDPFSPQQRTAATTKPTDQPKPSNNRQLSVLERYAVADLRMVGTISKNQTSWGLLESPDGIVHRVVVGDYVGTHQGRIQAIHTDKVIVLEQTPQNAENLSRRVVLTLQTTS